MLTRPAAFNPAVYADKLRAAAAELCRQAPSCTQRALLAVRIERRAVALLRPDGIGDGDEWAMRRLAAAFSGS